MKLLRGTAVRDIKIDRRIEARLGELRGKLTAKADGKFTSFEDFLSLPFSGYASKNLSPIAGVSHVVVVGIGGSSLGPKAVYDTLFGYFDSVTPSRVPKLHFVENVDKRYIDSLVAMCAPEELAFVVICKSGKTFETLKNLEYLTSDKYRGLVKGGNTYVISVEGNHTWEWGKTLGAQLFPMPQIVSGRFQVFSAVSLVPLGLAGVNTTKFVGGAKVSDDDFPALRYQYYKEGLTTDVCFVFDERLKSLAEWVCSITAESLGKDGKGITPIASVGSKDNHAMTQLYLQGPKDKFTQFISLSNTDPDNLIALAAVKKAYDDIGLPYEHVELDASSVDTLTYELGYFMQSGIIETVLLGGLMGVNPYDQPGVELYKRYLL